MAAASPISPVVRLEGVKKRFGTTEVLAGVSFEVATPQMVAIVGASGSGKSTLLHLIGGLDRKYDGKVEVLGRDLFGLGERELAALRSRELGFVFQSFNLIDHLSVRENVALPALFSADGAAVEGRLTDALTRVALGQKLDAHPTELSGGQKQRVAIARALVTQPRMLLADEPTGNLDAQTGEEILDLFASLVAGGLTVIVVTHEERVWRRAARVFELANGHLHEKS